jgi:predicted  nucleic acid-binding Zn-ribbon protein
MSQDLDARLKAAVAERDRLAAEAQRIAGRKEAAEKALSEVEKEIREKNLDPDVLDETIQKLKDAYEKAVETFEREVQEARDALSPYMESP